MVDVATRPVGVLLAQLGTPDEPTPLAVRRYLKEFLSDTRVIDLNPLLWQLILRLFVLRVRPARSAALYRRVWLPKARRCGSMPRPRRPASRPGWDRPIASSWG